jgi:hypothetical protein
MILVFDFVDDLECQRQIGPKVSEGSLGIGYEILGFFR